MSYSIITTILLATIALSSSVSFVNNEQNVLARFYSDFAQLYRSAIVKSYFDQGQTTELYQFFFTEREYLHISEKSLTMLNTHVIERTITYHPMPNFEIVGSRYFYRRDPKQNFSVEIELINPADRLFREVQQPNRYFYLLSFDNLEYSNQIPVMPYYEVTFICNTTFPTNTQAQLPLLSYIDKSFQYTPRYVLDLPLMGTNKQSEMYAYADIFNNGDQSIVIKGAELIAGDISLNPRPFGYFRTGLSDILSYQFGEQTSGTYVYQLSLPSSMILPPSSIKSVSFFQPILQLTHFVIIHLGKLLNAYNLTSFNNFLPNGRLFLREQGRFLGQIDLPDLSMEETYTMLFGFDVDVLYRRQVEIIEGDENSDSITYYVEYVFENFKTLYDVRVYFTESFSLFKYFQIKNISTSNDNKNFPDLISYGTDLRGYILLPRQNVPKIISYNIITYKFKPTVNFHEQ